MSVTIRLKRAGARHRPFFKVVVTDSRMPRDGRFIATLGIYDPLAESENVKIDVEQAKEWMDKGAKPSVTVTHLLRRAGMVPPKPELAEPTQAVSLDDLRSTGTAPSGEPETVEVAGEGRAEEKPVKKKAAPKKGARSAKRTPKKKSE